MEASSRQLVWRQKKHDSRVYCADDVAQLAGDDVLITDADDRRCRRVTQQSVRYFGALLCRHRWTVTANLYWTRSATSSQCKSACRIRVSPQSYLRMPLTRRAAAFNTRCSLSVTDLGAPASMTYHSKLIPALTMCIQHSTTYCINITLTHRLLYLRHVPNTLKDSY